MAMVLEKRYAPTLSLDVLMTPVLSGRIYNSAPSTISTTCLAVFMTSRRVIVKARLDVPHVTDDDHSQRASLTPVCSITMRLLPAKSLFSSLEIYTSRYHGQLVKLSFE